MLQRFYDLLNGKVYFKMRSMTLADIKRAITSMNGMEAARNGKQDKKVGFI